MSDLWKWNFVAILAASLVVPASAHEPTKASSIAASLDPAVLEAAAVTDAFHAALNSGDEAAALRLLADDVMIFESGGAERSKAEYAAHHLSADAQFSKATTRTITQRMERVTGDMAWIATDSRTTGTFKDRPIDVVGTETMVLSRVAGKWRIAHIHWSSAKSK